MASPEVSNTERLLEAAIQDDVETLRQLLDSPELYEVRDANGNNLLKIAVSRRRKRVFDYLLSLGDFPLDAVDGRGHTALEHIIIKSYNHNHDNSGYAASRSDYAIQLIKKGANINGVYKGDSLLHLAIESDASLGVMQSLIERGADVNRRDQLGSTPLHLSAYWEEKPKITMMLLYYGADPSVLDGYNWTAFDTISENWRCNSQYDGMQVARENLFYFTVDEWSLLNCNTLMHLAEAKSPLLYQVVKFNPKIIITDSHDLSNCCLDILFTFDSDYLRILLENYPYVVKKCLQSYSENLRFRNVCFNVASLLPRSSSADTFHLQNLEILIQSSLSSDTVELISKLNSRKIVPCILHSGKSIEEMLELIYYLLSYGMLLKQRDLQDIYKRTGYSKDFKNLLFMDIKHQYNVQITEMMPRLILDITLDIHKVVEDASLCEFIDWEQIFHYFVHPKIQNAYRQLKPDEAVERRLPKIPLLKELARDSFRKYFIKRLEITTAKQFYTLLQRLKISNEYKKIITYETKLY